MKGLTPIFIMTMMHFYQNFSLGAYLYVGNIDLIMIAHNSWQLWDIMDCEGYDIWG